MMALFGGELLKHGAAALILGEPGGAGVELQAASLRRDGHAQRVPGEHQLRGGAVDRRGLLARPAVVAGPEDLHDRAGGREAARRRNLLHERFDIRAQKLRRSMALGADQMKMPGMPVRRLVPRSAFAEIHLARDVGVDHPLERPVHGRAANSRFLPADDVEEIVGAEVTRLTQKYTEDAVALAGALTAGRTKAGIIGKRTGHDRVGELVIGRVGEFQLAIRQVTNSPIRQLRI